MEPFLLFFLFLVATTTMYHLQRPVYPRYPPFTPTTTVYIESPYVPRSRNGSYIL